MSSYPPYIAYPSAPPVQRAMPKPPRLHWGWVLAINALTRGIFGSVWLLVIAVWVRKVNGRSAAFVWSILHVAFFPVAFLMGVVVGIVAVVTHTPVNTLVLPVQVLAVVGVVTLYVVTTFTLRSELQAMPIGIPLGGVMTFFFGPIYFAYHLRDYVPDGRSGDMLSITQPPMQQGYPAQPSYPAPPQGYTQR